LSLLSPLCLNISCDVPIAMAVRITTAAAPQRKHIGLVSPTLFRLAFSSAFDVVLAEFVIQFGSRLVIHFIEDCD